MKFLDICAGIGGFRLALERAGHECIGFIEIDKFARKSYKAIHGLTGDKEYSEWEWHNVKSLSNKSLRKLRSRVGQLGAIAAGFPCQTFSYAGKRKGFGDTRGTVFFDIARAASILEPRYLFLENVKGLLNHEGGATFETILRTLDELGYDVEWDVLNSKDYVPQNRERLIIIGHLRGAGTRKVFPLDRNDEPPFELQGQSNETNTITARYGSASGVGSYIIESKQPEQVVIPVLSPDRLNKNQNGRRFKESGDEMFTLTAQDRHGVAIIQKPRGYNAGGEHEIAPTISANSWHENNLLKIGGVYTNDSADFNRGILPGLSRSIKSQNHDAGVSDGFRIRKLTPRECWRLQTFPDWAFDRAAAVNSDSQLYKQAGNSVTVDLIYDVARHFI